MSDDATPRLGLPYLAAAQAQKHVTHNEALALLDAMVQTAALSRSTTAQPGSPADGDLYILPGSATGSAWAGKPAGTLMRFEAGAWAVIPQSQGAVAYVVDEDVFVVSDGSAWSLFSLTIRELQNLELLGVGATADSSNPLLAKLNAALFTALTAGEGGSGDLRIALNKETASDVLSLLFQTGFSGRAELGLIGDDNVGLKVSPDGSAWTQAITVNKTTGKTTLANGSVAYAAIQAVSATDKLLGRASSGSGVIEEIAATAFARSLLDDPDAATARGTLGALGSGCDIQRFTASGTWTKPAGARLVRVIATGGGGGGGGGALAAASTATSGGAGGGGSVRIDATFEASDLGSTETVTVGAGGSGGAGAASVGAGSTGGSGGSSSFGVWLTTPAGGGGGSGGAGRASGGGGGAGTATAGGVASGATAGGAGSGGGAAGGSGGLGTSGVVGGAGGAGSDATGAAFGGTASAQGCGAGASGAGVTVANAVAAGGAGGRALGHPSGGGAAGTSGGGAGGTLSATKNAPGAGGGGGGSATSANGGAGGAGQAPGGAGGGGGSSQTGFAGGAGGDGGRGEVLVLSFY